MKYMGWNPLTDDGLLIELTYGTMGTIFVAISIVMGYLLEGQMYMRE